MFLGDGLYREDIGLSVPAEGLFAASFIPKMQMVTEYAGTVTSRTEFDKEKEETSYIVSLGPHAQLDGGKVKPEFGVPCAQWANHPFGDQQPNVQFVRATSPNVEGATRGGTAGVADRVWLRALRDIQPGEELIVFYGAGWGKRQGREERERERRGKRQGREERDGGEREQGERWGERDRRERGRETTTTKIK